MDPNFVQHSLADISARFLGYLVFILAYSTGIHGGVNGMFKTFGVDISTTKKDDFVKGFLGIAIALMVDLNFLFYVAGLTNGQFANSLDVRTAEGSPSAWFPPMATIFVCNIITGTLVVGGKRVIVGIAEEFSSGYQKIKNLLENKANGGAQ
jgi:hypothetical protein